MMLDDFIKEFSKDKEKKIKVSDLGNIPHGSEALIISKISEYIIKNIERSYEKVFKFIKEIDDLSLSSGKSININLIKKVLINNEKI